MAQLSKPLMAALKARKPETMSKLAKACKVAAEKGRNSAKMLDEAGQAFAQGDENTALQMLQHAEDCLSQS